MATKAKSTGKTSTKAKAAKKPAAKKATVKAAPAKKAPTTAITDKMTNGQVITHVTEQVLANSNGELKNKQAKDLVKCALDEVRNLMIRHLKRKGAGEFNFMGLIKLKVDEKPATKARTGVNPFTGEQMTIKAKPKRRVVKARALKKLKDEVVA